METKNYSSHIYKPLMAGLFAGYIATVLNLVYDVLFREATTFPLHDLVNVSTIIFATLFALPLAGVVFALGTPLREISHRNTETQKWCLT
ncbi:MAG: hypothetical protein J7599_09325 [Niabella sp.]|nr:hypothetical protein [Niabella sp.]